MKLTLLILISQALGELLSNNQNQTKQHKGAVLARLDHNKIQIHNSSSHHQIQLLKKKLNKRFFHDDDNDYDPNQVRNQPVNQIDPDHVGWIDREFGDYEPSPHFVEPLCNMQTYYTIELSIGSPFQYVKVLIDTGSSDLWVPGLETGTKNGYDSCLSESWISDCEDEQFYVEYVKGFASGYWGFDTIDFLYGSSSIMEQRFAVACQSSDIEMGVFGIGPPNAESSKRLYNNIPLSMVKQGLTAKALYSIYLDNWEANHGNIVFGGIDLTKFIPPLHTIPMLSTQSFKVTLSSLLIDGEEVGYPIGVVLDTGTSLCYLPDDFIDAIAAAFDAHWEPKIGFYVISKKQYWYGPCVIEFDFQGQVISVPKEELWWPLKWLADVPPTEDMALTMVSNCKSLGYNILGDTFLRSAYVVYDLEFRQISIAQSTCAKWNDIDIMPISEQVPGTQAGDCCE